MVVTTSPPLVAPRRQQSGDFSATEISAMPSGDFSTLLFLVLGALPVQNSLVPGEQQPLAQGSQPMVVAPRSNSSAAFGFPLSTDASANVTVTDGLPVADRVSMLPQGVAASKAGEPQFAAQGSSPVVAVQNNSSAASTSPLPSLLAASVAGTSPSPVVEAISFAAQEIFSGKPTGSAAAEELAGETLTWANSTDEGVSAPAQASALETLVVAATDSNAVAASGEPNVFAPVTTVQREQTTRSPKSPISLHGSAQNITASSMAVAKVEAPQDKTLAIEPMVEKAEKGPPTVPPRDVSSAEDIGLGENLVKVTVTKNDSGVASQTLSPVTKDVKLDKSSDLSSGMENSSQEKTNGEFEFLVHEPKISGDQKQNLASAFDDHGSKTFDPIPEGSRDHSTQPANLSTPFPSIAMHNVDSPKNGEPSPSPLPLMDQVAGEIANSVRQNKHEAVLTLDPPELGSLKINLSLDGGKVQVHIIAEAHESRSLIENHLPELKQALQLHRLDLVDARVENGGWNATTGDLTHGFQHGPGNRQESGANFGGPSQPESEPTETQEPENDQPAVGRVSMWA